MKNIDMDWDKVDFLIDNALNEDLGSGDITTDSIFPPDLTCEAKIVVKEKGTVAGIPVAQRVFEKLDGKALFTLEKQDGDKVLAGDELFRINAAVRAVLSGERLALNLLQRMSGIATATSKYVEILKGTNTKILDTRKTAPGLRVLDKYSVLAGGGHNHRFGLYDAVLIKDNHIKFAGSITKAVKTIRAQHGHKYIIEVETSNLDEVEEALESGAEIIMLDNMSVSMMREAVSLINGRALSEASGGITLVTLPNIAETGVNYISIGALTHSSAALDISLYMV
jgi:nicotinate-nucleotide pyrophosphorylase (carboxylating)